MAHVVCMNAYKAYKTAKARLDNSEYQKAINDAMEVISMSGFDLDDLDFLGISEDEAEDKNTNVEGAPEDVTPDTLEDQGFWPEGD